MSSGPCPAELTRRAGVARRFEPPLWAPPTSVVTGRNRCGGFETGLPRDLGYAERLLRAWGATVATAFEFVVLNVGEHGLAGETVHDYHKAAGCVGKVVAVLVVDDVAAWFEE